MARVVVTQRFGYTQATPATAWIIQHNLNIASPVVDVWIPENGNGPLTKTTAYTVEYNSLTTITITFSGPAVSGQVLIT